MLIDEFKLALSAATVQPKGAKISLELWKALKDAGLIQMRGVAAWGVFDLGFEMPFYQDTCLIYDPELELAGENFQLPPNAS
jgi:hypothetical protein